MGNREKNWMLAPQKPGLRQGQEAKGGKRAMGCEELTLTWRVQMSAEITAM